MNKIKELLNLDQLAINIRKLARTHVADNLLKAIAANVPIEMMMAAYSDDDVRGFVNAYNTEMDT